MKTGLVVLALLMSSCADPYVKMHEDAQREMREIEDNKAKGVTYHVPPGGLPSSHVTPMTPQAPGPGMPDAFINRPTSESANTTSYGAWCFVASSGLRGLCYSTLNECKQAVRQDSTTPGGSTCERQ